MPAKKEKKIEGKKKKKKEVICIFYIVKLIFKIPAVENG